MKQDSRVFSNVKVGNALSYEIVITFTSGMRFDLTKAGSLLSLSLNYWIRRLIPIDKQAGNSLSHLLCDSETCFVLYIT